MRALANEYKTQPDTSTKADKNELHYIIWFSVTHKSICHEFLTHVNGLALTRWQL